MPSFMGFLPFWPTPPRWRVDPRVLSMPSGSQVPRPVAAAQSGDCSKRPGPGRAGGANFGTGRVGLTSLAGEERLDDLVYFVVGELFVRVVPGEPLHLLAVGAEDEDG